MAEHRRGVDRQREACVDEAGELELVEGLGRNGGKQRGDGAAKTVRVARGEVGSEGGLLALGEGCDGGGQHFAEGRVRLTGMLHLRELLQNEGGIRV